MDFHIHPHCWDSACQASGDYINDDGLVLNLEGNQNVYKIKYYTRVSPAQLTLSFEQPSKATNYKGSRVNGNDALGRVEIYNARAQGLVGRFSVEALLKDHTLLLLHDASYDAAADRLVHPAVQDLWLPDILELVFTQLEESATV